MPRHGPPDHTGPEAVAGLAKRRAKRGVGDAQTVQAIRAETITVQKVSTALITAAKLGENMRSIKIQLSGDTRGFLRKMRECQLAIASGWIDADPPTFAFPGWGPQWRPFDFEVDA
jgi:hypothetical protein